MNSFVLLYFVLVPVGLLSSTWLIRKPSQITALAAVLFWIQTGSLFGMLLPVLRGAHPELILTSDLQIDRLGALFALLTQLMAVSAVTHAHIYFRFEKTGLQNLRMFYSSVALLVPAMIAIFFCNNMGVMWISIEATTLCSAPLIHFHSSKHSLEATWKYLTICGVGIAFALFGTMFIVASSQHGAIDGGSLLFSSLLQSAKQLEYPLLKLGYLFCLLGYGTKAGVFPLHGWLPDAYSEAPSPASALLSGGLLNCSLFAIWRVSDLVQSSGHGALSQGVGIWVGTISVFFASMFLVRQHGLKRLFAYSSIENVGLMLIAIGLNSGQLFFTLAVNFSLAKVALFLISGNVIQSSGSKSLHDLRGLLTVSPVWSTILILGAFAVTGCPPFGTFVAEWQLLSAICQRQSWVVFSILLGCLALSFLAITMHLARILGGVPRRQLQTLPMGITSIVPGVLIVVSLICGLTTIPQFWL